MAGVIEVQLGKVTSVPASPSSPLSKGMGWARISGVQPSGLLMPQ